MKLIPLGKRTIVKPIENKEVRSTGGIILSIAVQEKYSDVAVVESSSKYAPGTMVLIPPYDFSQVAADGKTYFIVNTDDVMGVIQNVQ
jgi:co-chaperonin GroES (HSP10)